MKQKTLSNMLIVKRVLVLEVIMLHKIKYKIKTHYAFTYISKLSLSKSRKGHGAGSCTEQCTDVGVQWVGGGQLWSTIANCLSKWLTEKMSSISQKVCA